MMKVTPRIVLVILVAMLLMLVFATASFGVSPTYSLQTLTEASDVVVIGQVVDLWTEKSQQDGMLYTYATITTTESLKGEALGTKLVVQTPGGELDGIGLQVSEAPRFEVGQRVLFFLEGKEPFHLVGWKEGAYEIQGEMLDNGLEVNEVKQAIARIAADESRSPALSAIETSWAELAGSRLSFSWQGHHWPGEAPMEEVFTVYENTPDCTGEADAIRAAMEEWSNVDCANFRFVYGGPGQGAVPALDGANTIRFTYMGSPGPLGVAYTWYDSGSMEIFEADIALNDSFDWSATLECPYNRLDVQSVATHELGHALGLKDLYGAEDTQKTMYGYSHYGEIKKRTLDQDDIDGLRTIYPAPCGGVAFVDPHGTWCEPGNWHTFTTTYYDENGWQNIKNAYFMVNETSESATGCIYARYDVQANRMFIRNPADSYWKPFSGVAPGTDYHLWHMFGRIDVGQCTIIPDGNTLTINWAVLFSWRESGQRHGIYLATESVDGMSSGWKTQEAMMPKSGPQWMEQGEWVVNRMPNYLIPPSELSPRFGTAKAGELYWFDPSYRDLDRNWDLDQLYLLIADTQPSDDAPDSQIPDGVYLKYDNSENMLYLWDGNRWLAHEPSSGVGSNPVVLRHASVVTRWSRPMVADFRTLKVWWRFKFHTSFRGRHKIYTRAIDMQGKAFNGDTGWKWKGWVIVE